jgi:uncharacterized damage-inducible protein DinB
MNTPRPAPEPATPVSLGLAELLDYSDHERYKWQHWIAADPSRLTLAFQPGGRFPTIGSVFDHIFLVERRHLARLEGGTPPDTTGVPAGDVDALFEYAALVRADFRHYLSELDEAVGAQVLTFAAGSGSFSMTRRKLVAHMLIHEIRHLAQVAFAARVAGVDPPRELDLAFFPEMA